uniref:Cytoplasmic polyadenylation element binding protein 4a n=1 Tax=Sinocyclocheilus grahami TaxID=75366 RepID=A0A672N044_SINGR
MQDDLLESETSKALQPQQESQEGQDKQTLSPPGHQEAPGIISELDNTMPEENQLEKGTMENANGKEALRLESPVLSGFDYQETSGIGTLAQSSSSSSSSLTGFSSWSTAIPPNPSTLIEEVGFFNQAATTNNAPPPLLFQSFSHHTSTGFGGNFSHQIGPLSQHHPSPHPHFQHPHNQHRRSSASPHPPPFSHRSAAFNQMPHLGNNLSKPVSPWGWGSSQGREYRRGLNGGVNPLNSISPLKKSFPNNQTPTPKYPRNNSGFNTKPWMEDTINRNDSIFPFQVTKTQSPLIIMWLNTASGEDDQRLLLHHCLAKLLPFFCHFKDIINLFYPMTVELAMIMDRLYGGVCYAGIDTDPELKYPKGAGRENQSKKMKPYVLDDQLCDECQGTRCGGKFAPFFCANVTCLQYYCEYCWAAIHSRAGREFHKPLVKEGGDRPRHISFRWN